jgi:hypothetical protein
MVLPETHPSEVQNYCDDRNQIKHPILFNIRKKAVHEKNREEQKDKNRKAEHQCTKTAFAFPRRTRPSGFKTINISDSVLFA